MRGIKVGKIYLVKQIKGHTIAYNMAKNRVTVTLDFPTLIEVARVQDKESRKSFSNTVETLLKEALEARKKKKTK